MRVLSKYRGMLMKSRRTMSSDVQAKIDKFDNAVLESTEYVQEQAAEVFSNQLTVIDYIQKKAEADPDRTSIIFNGEKFSRKWHVDKLNQTSHLAKELGLEEDDKIAFLSYNSPDFIATQQGFANTGVAPALINTSMQGSALKHCIEISDAKFVIVGGAPEHEAALENINLKIPIISANKNYGLGTLNDLRSKMSTDRLEDTDIGPMSTSCLIFTSGTTGLPKAAIKTQLQTAISAAVGGHLFNLHDDSRLQMDLPLFHFSGSLNCQMALGSGAQIIVSEKFSASKAVDTLKKYQSTHMVYIGETLRFINQVAEKSDDKENSLYALFGNGVATAEWVKFINRFGKDIWVNEVYGATELPNILYSFPQMSSPGSISRLTPTQQESNGIKIVQYDTDTEDVLRGDDGKLIPCAFNEPGMVVMRTSDIHQFTGYYGNQKKTDEKKIFNAFEEDDCWINSGDLMVMDDEYEVYFCDRLGDTYRWKGENVSASEVERIITTSDIVGEAVVYGTAIDGNEGKVGTAVLKRKAGQTIEISDIEKLVTACNENLLSAARPRIYRVQDTLQMTDTFKYKKAAISKEAILPGDFFVARNKDVSIFTEETIKDLLEGRCNNVI